MTRLQDICAQRPTRDARCNHATISTPLTHRHAAQIGAGAWRCLREKKVALLRGSPFTLCIFSCHVVLHFRLDRGIKPGPKPEAGTQYYIELTSRRVWLWLCTPLSVFARECLVWEGNSCYRLYELALELDSIQLRTADCVHRYPEYKACAIFEYSSKTGSTTLESQNISCQPLITMTFHHSAEDIRIDDGHILRARLQRADGEWNDSEIDLNNHIGNDNGLSTYIGFHHSPYHR